MSFSSDIRRFRINAERATESVFKNSAQELGRVSNTPRANGGNTPVDTGFLINSQAYALGSMPSGPSTNPQRQTVTTRMGDGPIEVLGRWQPGQTVYIGWVAKYARFMEYRYGFVRLAAQQWPDIVRRNSR